MPKKTKYCLNFHKGKHLNDGKSPSNMHCSSCYDEVKQRYANIDSQGGRLQGLRGARLLAGGSFGYERSPQDKERNLRAFFFYVMPEIHGAKVDKLVKEIAHDANFSDMVTEHGIKKVKMY